MKHLKNFRIFESSGVTELDIEEYLKSKFTSDWFDSELSDRVYEYIDEDDAEDYGGDYEEAYRNLSTGGAIEYDLISVMSDDVSNHFGIDEREKIDVRDVSDICSDHLMDTCSWYDRYTFDRKSTEPYKSKFGYDYDSLKKMFDDDEFDSIKL